MAQIKADEITQLLREQIANYDSKVQVDEVGTITSLGDGIARLHGLDKVMAGELLSFPHGIAGLALSLEEDHVGAGRRWWGGGDAGCRAGAWGSAVGGREEGRGGGVGAGAEGGGGGGERKK